MHKIQAQVLSDIIAYVQDKTEKISYIQDISEENNAIKVQLIFRIPDNYPGMEKDKLRDWAKRSDILTRNHPCTEENKL